MSTNVDLTERLLNPETVEEALKEFGAEWQYKTVVRELHERLKTAKAEGAAETKRRVALHELWARAEADLAAAREDVARIQLERDRALGELQEMDRQWRPVDLGPKGEWFMGRLGNSTEKPLRRLPGGSSYEYSDVNETYYSWYWLTHWRPLTDDERAAIDAARAQKWAGVKA